MSRSAIVLPKAFRRFLENAPHSVEPAMRSALDQLAPALESEGFRLVAEPFDGATGFGNSLNFERSPKAGVTDYVLIVFDRHFRARFQVLFGAKETNPPHAWVRAGALVWKGGSESVKFKWWGAKWWHFDKSAALRSDVSKVLLLIPEAAKYLSTGSVGPCVLPQVIGPKLPRR